MKFIALMGLMAVEKIELTKHLVQQERQAGRTTLVLDDIAHLSIDPADLDVAVTQLDDELSTSVPRVLRTTDADTIVLAVSEYTPPDAIFASLDAIAIAFSDLEMHIVALIDTRTCDCFPQVRHSYESFADTVIRLPMNLEEVTL